MKSYPIVQLATRHRVVCAYLLATLVLVSCVILHVPGINGPWYWKWLWQHPPLESYVFILAAFLPFFLAQYLACKRNRFRTALAMLVVANLVLQFVYAYTQSDAGIADRLINVISSPVATSYLTAALEVESARHLLENYPALLEHFPLHAKNKPIGAVLYYYPLLQILGEPETAALWGAVANMVLASLAIVVVYRLAMRLFESRGNEIAWGAASLYAIIPSAIVFSPGYDQWFPLLASLLALTWVIALTANRLRYAVAFALILAASTLITWNILASGVILLLLSLYYVRTNRISLVRLAIHAITAAATYALVYSAIYILTSYNVIDVFLRSMEIQSVMASEISRPWRFTIFFDIYDFLLGGGFLVGLLMVHGLIRRGGYAFEQVFALFVCIQLAILSLSYLLPAETARVWLFLQPFATIAAACQLKELAIRQRLILFCCLAAMTTVISQNMMFIVP